VAFVALLLISCAAKRQALIGPGAFRVIPATGEYRLRAPDASESSFNDTLNRYRDQSVGWVDLQSRTELHIEAAYYRDGSADHTLSNYLGTEVARFQIRSNGHLQLTSVQSGLKGVRGKQTPVQDLVPRSQRRYHYSRLFYSVRMNRTGDTRTAILLGANTTSELGRLTMQLFADPGSVCGPKSTHCTVFPETCTASLDIEIVVNGVTRTVAWGNALSSIAASPRHVEMQRLDAGRLVPVEIDSNDPRALRLPLLPGDRITWE
jgi:hypothetical protein